MLHIFYLSYIYSRIFWSFWKTNACGMVVIKTYVLTFELGKKLIFRNVHNYTKSKSVKKKNSKLVFFILKKKYTHDIFNVYL